VPKGTHSGPSSRSPSPALHPRQSSHKNVHVHHLSLTRVDLVHEHGMHPGSMSVQASLSTASLKSMSAACLNVESTTPLVAIPASTRVSIPPARNSMSRSEPEKPLTLCLIAIDSPGKGATAGWTSVPGLPGAKRPLSRKAPKDLFNGLTSG